MYFHVYLIYRFTRTFTDHSSVITRCWGFELQNGKSSLKSPQTLATQDFAPASFLSTPDNWMTPPNSNKSMRLANLVGLFYTLKALTWQRFGGLTHHEKSEMKRLKPLQIEVENIKVRRFEPHYLIWRSCWSFLPPGKALNSSVCNEVVWYCKTQYRKRHLLEICQNASFLSTPDKLDKSCV